VESLESFNSGPAVPGMSVVDSTARFSHQWKDQRRAVCYLQYSRQKFPCEHSSDPKVRAIETKNDVEGSQGVGSEKKVHGDDQ
jgi:hypothetical protein